MGAVDGAFLLVALVLGLIGAVVLVVIFNILTGGGSWWD